MERARQRGFAQSIGVSNFSVAELQTLDALDRTDGTDRARESKWW